MAYHPLTNDTGGTADDRRAEASRILSILSKNGVDSSVMSPREQGFYEQMADDETQPVSPKQLFWLRDIKDKYL
jgi:hypothetical protein